MRINSLNLVDKKGSAMKFDIEGKLRKMPVVKNYRLPLFEAVSNSIQSIQLRQKNNPEEKDFSGKVSVYVKFKPGTENLSNSAGIAADGGIIDSFRIVDNGEGFTEENFVSFDTMDTLLKQAEFACKGEGRFLWLKSFRNIRIQSVFKNENELFERNFTFDKLESLVHQNELPKPVPLAKGQETTVYLSGILDSVANKKPIELNDIAEALLSHFLLDLLTENAPEISVIEEDTHSKVVVNDKLKDCVIGSMMENEFEVKGFTFKLTGQKIKDGVVRSKLEGVHWSAGKRIVEAVKLSGLVPELSEQLSDPDSGELFSYVAVVSSSFLDESVDSSRTRIQFPKEQETTEDVLLPSEKEIKEALASAVRTQLKDSLTEIRSRGKKRLTEYVETEGPEFRAFLNADQELYISPRANQKQVRDYLTVKFADFEVERNHKVDELLKVDWVDVESPEDEITKIQKQVSPVNHHCLAKFASMRKFYVEMLAKVCEFKKAEDKEYQYENALHSLIYPMKKDSDNVGNAHNLWLIDDSLAFHHYVTSDLGFNDNKTLDSDSEDAPDLYVLNVFGDGDASETSLAELVLVEFKRPGRKDYSGTDKDPFIQVVNYVRKIKESSLQTKSGTLIPVKNCSIYYYLIADITSSLADKCIAYNLDVNARGDRYYGYNRVGMFIEVMTLDALRRRAKERHRALWKAAGLR